MKTRFSRSQALRRLLREAHYERESLPVDDRWVAQTLAGVRRLAAAGGPPAGPEPADAFSWPWLAAGGLATAALALLLIHYPFIPDADLWSFLVYEDESMNMMLAFLY